MARRKKQEPAKGPTFVPTREQWQNLYNYVDTVIGDKAELTMQEVRLIKAFRKLDETGKNYLEDTIEFTLRRSERRQGKNIIAFPTPPMRLCA